MSYTQTRSRLLLGVITIAVILGSALFSWENWGHIVIKSWLKGSNSSLRAIGVTCALNSFYFKIDKEDFRLALSDTNDVVARSFSKAYRKEPAFVTHFILICLSEVDLVSNNDAIRILSPPNEISLKLLIDKLIECHRGLGKRKDANETLLIRYRELIVSLDPDLERRRSLLLEAAVNGHDKNSPLSELEMSSHVLAALGSEEAIPKFVQLIGTLNQEESAVSQKLSGTLVHDLCSFGPRTIDDVGRILISSSHPSPLLENALVQFDDSRITPYLSAYFKKYGLTERIVPAIAKFKLCEATEQLIRAMLENGNYSSDYQYALTKMKECARDFVVGQIRDNGLSREGSTTLLSDKEIVTTIIRVGLDEAIPAIELIMENRGNKHTAEILINSGEARLKSIASLWAAKNGYSTLNVPASQRSVSWGK